MSFNIYEDPNLSLNMKYSRGVADDRGEREERLVDIYERGSDQQVDVSTQDRGAHVQNYLPAVQRNLLGVAALVLGLLCLLLLVGVTVLYILYNSVTREQDQLHNSYEKLKNSYEELKISHENLLNGYCDGRESHTKGKITKWSRFRGSCYYKSTEMKSWTDSRTDCQSREADLVIINNKAEQDFLKTLNGNGTFWIGLLSETTSQWKNEWGWKLVDGSMPQYWAWDKDTNPTAVAGSRAYIDLHLRGTWRHTNNGSKQWICEKQIVWELPRNLIF